MDDPNTVLLVFEDLKIPNLVRSGRGAAAEPGRNVPQKAGLNRSILQSAWGLARQFSGYKSRKRHKLSIRVPAFGSSQECRLGGYTHPDNRISQSEFVCQACGHQENADRNASHVLKQRGVDLILSGNWKPKHKKRVKITAASKLRKVRPEGSAGRYGRKGRNRKQSLLPTTGEST